MKTHQHTYQHQTDAQGGHELPQSNYAPPAPPAPPAAAVAPPEPADASVAPSVVMQQSFTEEVDQAAAAASCELHEREVALAAPLGFKFALCNLDELELLPKFCHREIIHEKRVQDLRQFRKRGCVLQPMIVWENEGKRYLMDGWHRYVLGFQDEIRCWPALILQGTPVTALKAAILQNRSDPDKLRKGYDAERAALIMGDALGRPLQLEEQQELGLELEPFRQDLVEHFVTRMRLPEGFRIMTREKSRKGAVKAKSGRKPAQSRGQQKKRKKTRR